MVSESLANHAIEMLDDGFSLTRKGRGDSEGSVAHLEDLSKEVDAPSPM
jgi:hypothetical protein